jgi:glutaredoxin
MLTAAPAQPPAPANSGFVMFNRLKRLFSSPTPTPAGTRTVPAAAAAAAPRPREPEQPRRSLAAPDGLDHTLLLYKYDACPFCQKVARAIDALGMSVPTADTRQDPNASRALVALTGGTQVPCLVIDGVPLLESADIIVWLQTWHAARTKSAPST